MKISLRKLIATVSGLAIAATLPVASLMASADDATPTLSIVADKTTAKKGDVITLSFNSTGNTKEMRSANITAIVKADATKLEADEDAVSGTLNVGLTNTDENGTYVNAMSAKGTTKDGTMCTLSFTVKEDLNEDTVISVKVKAFAYANYDANGKFVGNVKLVDEQDDYAKITVSAPVVTSTSTSTSTSASATATSATGAASSATGAVTSATGAASTDADTSETDATDATEDTDVVVPTEDNGGNGGAQTGESTTLFVLALVLMAGSAVALVGMKKKVFSK